MMGVDHKDAFLGCLLGLAVGDAVGTTLEFKMPGSFTPLTDMVGGGPFNLRPGEWTDDTSMALCIAESLIECNGFDPADQMERYLRWSSEGHLSSNGFCFDIGHTVSQSLQRFKKTREPYSGSTDPYSAGNGCIMRLAPIPMFFAENIDEVLTFSGESSRTTHGAQECIDACRLFGWQIAKALNGADKQTILTGYPKPDELQPKIKDIAEAAYWKKEGRQIQGSGYVVQCLEAALWCFDKTDNFQDAILKAANLGDDADTTAAVCGQIAGAYYGSDSIPRSWLEKLAKWELIETFAEKLFELSQGR